MQPYKTPQSRKKIYQGLIAAIDLGMRFHLCSQLAFITKRKVYTVMNYFPELQQQEPTRHNKYDFGWCKKDRKGMAERRQMLKRAITLCNKKK